MDSRTVIASIVAIIVVGGMFYLVDRWSRTPTKCKSDIPSKVKSKDIPSREEA